MITRSCLNTWGLESFSGVKEDEEQLPDQLLLPWEKVPLGWQLMDFRKSQPSCICPHSPGPLPPLSLGTGWNNRLHGLLRGRKWLLGLGEEARASKQGGGHGREQKPLEIVTWQASSLTFPNITVISMLSFFWIFLRKKQHIKYGSNYKKKKGGVTQTQWFTGTKLMSGHVILKAEPVITSTFQ